ncbi:hypothetical protein, partial [Aeromonas taiwanensis]
WIPCLLSRGMAMVQRRCSTIGISYLVRAFEAGFGMGGKPVDATTVETIMSRRIDDLDPQLTRHGYDIRALCAQFDARPPEVRQLMRGTLNSQRTNELIEEMRAAGLPL